MWEMQRAQQVLEDHLHPHGQQQPLQEDPQQALSGRAYSSSEGGGGGSSSSSSSDEEGSPRRPLDAATNLRK